LAGKVEATLDRLSRAEFCFVAERQQWCAVLRTVSVRFVAAVGVCTGVLVSGMSRSGSQGKYGHGDVCYGAQCNGSLGVLCTVCDPDCSVWAAMLSRVKQSCDLHLSGRAEETRKINISSTFLVVLYKPEL
jgi:hypothetical protein